MWTYRELMTFGQGRYLADRPAWPCGELCWWLCLVELVIHDDFSEADASVEPVMRFYPNEEGRANG